MLALVNPMKRLTISFFVPCHPAVIAGIGITPRDTATCSVGSLS
jgi:hypothetical protein